MTRKAFLEDLVLAARKTIAGVRDVKKGDEDGEFNFTYVPVAGPSVIINILVTDVPGYPFSTQFVLYTLADVDLAINEVLEYFEPKVKGTRIQDLIYQVSSELRDALATGSREDPYKIDDGPDEPMLGSDSDPEDYQFSFDSPTGAPLNAYSDVDDTASIAFNNRIVADLRATRLAGFKIGILSGMKAQSSFSLVSISVQVVKLGLSDETLQAWDLQKQQHIVLLVRYSGMYKTFEGTIQDSAPSKDVEFRVGVCDRYKPNVTQAAAAFSTSSKPNASKSAQPDEESPEIQEAVGVAGFQRMFVSSSLDEYLNNQFFPLLKIRHTQSVDWDGARRILKNTLGKIGNDRPTSCVYEDEEPKSPTSELPDFVAADHIMESNVDKLSLTLIAMQFAMKYLVRCTEFCLICHDKTEETFEAMKPYVCSKPLCLYQYMSLGFGPSIEHEILTEPDVVDLLISFCYQSAKFCKLREYPTGMSLAVPSMRAGPIVPALQTPDGSIPVQDQLRRKVQLRTEAPGSASQIVKYDSISSEIVLEPDSICTLRRGDWIVLNTIGNQPAHHRVEEVLLPTVRLSKVPVRRGSCQSNDNDRFPSYQTSPTSTPAATPPPSSMVTADMDVYNLNFDDLTPDEKGAQIVMLLETIPSIKEMRSYLTKGGRSSAGSLRNWSDRISPAALGLMRWIVASNRSCIVQIDNCPGQDDSNIFLGRTRLDQRVTNMEGYIQFRFAQGAPDKEQRFLKALVANKDSLSATYPTLFAWHGSALPNWHSIIRSGLDFSQVANGRAFGDGCYHSQDLSTSLGYSGLYGYLPSSWPGSSLQITQAVCLNEIVNLPQRYKSSTPHLVVQYVDWIQCRYLFVKTAINKADETAVQVRSVSGTSRVSLIQQDPRYTVKGANRQPIGIPTAAVSNSRAVRWQGASPGSTSPAKRQKLTSRFPKGPVSPDIQTFSDDEDAEDLAFLISRDDASGETDERQKEKYVSNRAQRESDPSNQSKSGSDFVAGSLDQSVLKMMKPPAYATSAATKTLTRELAAVMKVQKSTPAGELGWYIDENMGSNLYQWIVELHSFDPSLPLAQDMKNAGITSVVLEIRFGKDYPMSPPFVRVIRPRFLPFMNGGGGHVTGGGAMCMELLTNSGWSAVSSIESVLLQVRLAIMNLEPKPARLERQGRHAQRDYGVGEAIEAYIRACTAHGWEVPKDFREFGVGTEY